MIRFKLLLILQESPLLFLDVQFLLVHDVEVEWLFLPKNVFLSCVLNAVEIHVSRVSHLAIGRIRFVLDVHELLV